MKTDFPAFKLANPAYEDARLELLHQYCTSSYLCGTFAREFGAKFPELRQVPGYYSAEPDDCDPEEHWWLVDQDGNIVDPTADQFPTREFGHYIPYDPRLHTIAKGNCPCCGAPIHSVEDSVPCSAECNEALSEEHGVALIAQPIYESEMRFRTDMDLVTRYGCQFVKDEIIASLIAQALKQQMAFVPQTF